MTVRYSKIRGARLRPTRRGGKGRPRLPDSVARGRGKPRYMKDSYVRDDIEKLVFYCMSSEVLSIEDR